MLIVGLREADLMEPCVVRIKNNINRYDNDYWILAILCVVGMAHTRKHICCVPTTIVTLTRWVCIDLRVVCRLSLYLTLLIMSFVWRIKSKRWSESKTVSQKYDNLQWVRGVSTIGMGMVWRYTVRLPTNNLLGLSARATFKIMVARMHRNLESNNHVGVSYNWMALFSTVRSDTTIHNTIWYQHFIGGVN
jgi:hypothetical protein